MNDRSNDSPHSTDDDRDRNAAVRRRAERRMVDLLQHRLPASDAPQIERLMHELGVHQIELDMQNEELRAAQSALEASRDRYQSLYEETPVGYVTLSASGNIVEANPMSARILGPEVRQLLQRRLLDFVAPEERERFHECCQRAMREHRGQYVELRLVRKGGAVLWAGTRVVMVADREERGALYRVTLDDITARIALQEDHARLAAIVGSSADAIVGRDVDGRITAWNRGAEQVFGYSPSEMLGQPLEVIVPDERIPEVEELLAGIRRGDRIETFETEWRNRQGRPVPLSLRVSPIVDDRGRLLGSSWIGRDTSQRKRDESALLNRLRQLDLLSQAGQALIMGGLSATHAQHDLFDRVRLAVGGEIYLNFRLDRAAGLLHLVSDYGLTPARRAQMASIPVEQALCGVAARRRAPLIVENLQSCELPEAQLLLLEGVRCYAGFPLLARDEIVGVAAFASTTRDRFREGDLQVIQTVCDQVSAMLDRERLLDELHARELSLQLADRRKDDFIATLAHELRNPLAPIRNAIGILRAVDLPDPKLVWCRDVIDRQVAQMTRLLEDLLDVNRVTRNKIELRRERFDLRRAVEAAIEANRPLIESQKHRLVLDMPDTNVAVYGDLTRLTQVVANLLNNAAKYTDTGGNIRVTVRHQSDDVAVSVRDDGIGMDPQQLPKVFEMFAQLKPALERSRGGLGIGLSLARGLVEQHGGRIDAHSAGVGQGSEFVMYLPVAHVADAPADDVRAEIRPEISGQRVLVVDDNADAAQTLATMLELRGLDVRVAFNGGEGLRVAGEWRPDAAVVDIGMPHFNGYELCRRIRENPWGERMLLIACTGWGQHEDRLRARAAGFDAHLVKPVDPEEVLLQLARGGAPAEPR